jgi:hypothetical protein
MQNVIRSQKTVSEEELKQIKELDWNSYYKEACPPDTLGMTNCPKCNAILLSRNDQSELSCYSCGERIK